MRVKRSFFLLSLITCLVLGLGLIWSLRLTWLPWLLAQALPHLSIDRMRYEEAKWEGQTITFFHLTLQHGAHRLYMDTLKVRLALQPSLFIHYARYEQDTAKSSAPPEPKSTPLSSSAQWLNRFSNIDTLFIQALEGPAQTCLQVRKVRSTWEVHITSPYGLLRLMAYQKAQVLSIFAPAARLETSKSFLSWKALKAQLRYRDTLTLQIHLDSVILYHPRLAATPLKYDSVGAAIESFARDTTWTFRLMPLALPLKAQVTLQYTRPNAFYLHLEIPSQPHTSWIRAFPQGFFAVLDKAQLQGESELKLDLLYDPRQPDTLSLEINWKPQGFGIKRWVGRNPLTLREPFTYTPWRSARHIRLGPENPNYLTYHQIHPYALFAILHSEDGGFFYHQGFHKELFLKAMLENWRCRCFRRGAGTITMQLVRNLLLTRQKTLARKVEEILLTALIERFHLLSKERILELYLNMVEWGPEVYGLSEAAQFYFAKSPYELSLSEAIFLGLILPSPRAYRYYINDSTQCAKASLGPAYEKIGYYVTQANYLPPESLATVGPQYSCLRGPARRIFLPPDSLSDLNE